MFHSGLVIIKFALASKAGDKSGAVFNTGENVGLSSGWPSPEALSTSINSLRKEANSEFSSD